MNVMILGANTQVCEVLANFIASSMCMQLITDCTYLVPGIDNAVVINAPGLSSVLRDCRTIGISDVPILFNDDGAWYIVGDGESPETISDLLQYRETYKGQPLVPYGLNAEVVLSSTEIPNNVLECIIDVLSADSSDGCIVISNHTEVADVSGHTVKLLT